MIRRRFKQEMCHFLLVNFLVWKSQCDAVKHRPEGNVGNCKKHRGVPLAKARSSDTTQRQSRMAWLSWGSWTAMISDQTFFFCVCVCGLV